MSQTQRDPETIFPAAAGPADDRGAGGRRADASPADDALLDGTPGRVVDAEAGAGAGVDGQPSATVSDDPEADLAGVVDLAELVANDPRSREELFAALLDAERQRDEYLDGLQRSRAEFENFRRRTVREAAGAREAGRGDVASALLDVLDDLDRTLGAADGSSDEALAKGVSLVAEKLHRSLGGQGLVRIAETGVAFDPEVHEAVQQVPAEDGAAAVTTVVSVLRPGYRFGDRVLRAAMVVVSG